MKHAKLPFLPWRWCFAMVLVVNLFVWPDSATADEIVQTAQQTTNVKGQVTDKKGEPLVGATVKIKHTTAGTITAVDGHFSLNVRSGGTLVISYIG